ncbi:phosphotransferase family protein [Promicromonospora kroppenstedtii]|uniref:phosphotransferase family protein n=1 Tax=Promicromonospora kroppenstedtii TaxID=440482 RepID=UPI0004B1AE80|nr:aminoglycoside phosphotransferase family protein [Promicromonospora kroppenstedtii]
MARLLDDPAALRTALSEAGAIQPGYSGSLEITRIGAEFGLSGTTASVRLDDDASPGLVVKLDTAETIRREQLFYTRYAAALAGQVPRYLGSVLDDDAGLLALELVAPAEQLDVLTGCDDATAERLVSLLATLHAATWVAPSDVDLRLPRWRRRPYAPDEWTALLDTARRRFPEIIDSEATERLAGLPGRVAGALDRLAAVPHAWIHADAHLDNVLRRPGGGVVLLDWATSCVGPPLADLAQLLAGGLVDDPSTSTRVAALLEVYAETLGAHGIETDPDDVASLTRDAVLPWVQGMVGWAAAPVRPTGRTDAVLRFQLGIAVAWS